MGIKAPEKPINIKDLVIEEPKRKEAAFDPKTLLTQKHWDSIFERISMLEENLHMNIPMESSAKKYLELIYKVAVLDPQKINRLNDDEEFTGNLVRQALDASFDVEDAIYLNYYKALFGQPNPTDFPEPPGPREVSYWVEEEGELEPFILAALASYKILHPQENLEAALEKLKLPIKESAEAEWNISEFAEMFAWTKVLYGDWDFLGVDKENFMESLKSWIGDDTGDDENLTLAFCLKILAAKEIKFTEHGMELIMEKPVTSLDTIIPALPEVKKYGS